MGMVLAGGTHGSPAKQNYTTSANTYVNPVADILSEECKSVNIN
mgnify:CR=1 FL=1|jgi:hypothetical protein